MRWRAASTRHLEADDPDDDEANEEDAGEARRFSEEEDSEDGEQRGAATRPIVIPMMNAPTAPMPVHTAYAVPMGIVRWA